MTPPGPTPEQVIAEALDFYTPEEVVTFADEARHILAALHAAGIPVGWEDVRERLTSDRPLRNAAREVHVSGITAEQAKLYAGHAINTAIDHAEEAR